MTKFNCDNCGESVGFEMGMVACPLCASVINEDRLDQLRRVSNDEEATAKDDIDATIKADPFDDDDEIDAGDSSKTAMAADLGYVDNPVHLKTMATPEEAYESATKSSAIPVRSVSEDDANGELRDYKIESKIDEGSFGFVYRAVQVPLDRYVAIKLLKPLPLPPSTESDQSKEVREIAELKVREEFLREAQFTGKLEHPNIVPIHDIGIVKSGKQSDRPFYVMKEIKGISWQDVFAEKSRDENTDIFKRVVDAVGFAHNNSILHCDLKPENVMLGEFGEVLVVDWGQAIDPSRPETYRPGGTPAYCSPEMAQYWCDFGQNPEGAQHSKRQIGPRSDVYLLGAILFQIVTGKTPHFGKKKETPADVMVRASRNEIRRHDAYVNDELMQIALRALRVAGDEINTVAQIKEALEVYEERKRSIEIRDRAFDLLDEAKSSSDYDVYQKAKFGFEESLQLWEDNKTAKNGLQKTRLSCAQMALSDENFDLGLGMLEGADSPAEVQLRNELATGKRQRDSRKKMIRVLSIAYVATLLIGFPSLIAVGIWGLGHANDATQAIAAKEKAQQDTETFKKDAVEFQQQVTQAKSDLKKASLAEQAATIQANTSRLAKEAAESDAQVLEYDNLLADFDLMLAQEDAQQKQQEATEAALQVEGLDKARIEAENLTKIAKEASRNLRYKNQVAAIEQKLTLGDFESARKLLDENFGNRTSSFEWRRLNLLAHPEVTGNSRFPENDPIHAATLSGDRSTVMLRFNDRIEIYATSDLLNPRSQIRVGRDEDSPFNALALSNDGSLLAVAEGDLDGRGRIQGYIKILKTDSGIQVGSRLSAQSKRITDLRFNRAGDKLLSVGEPLATRRSTSEPRPHELMVWEGADRGNWQPLNSPKMYGNQIHLSKARFSNDGRRIVTSNPDGDRNRRFVYVLELRDNRYHWMLGEDRFDSRNPQQIDPVQDLKSGFVESQFGDDSGNSVISSFSDGDNHQLVIWSVDSPEQTVPVAFTSTIGPDTAVSNVKYPSFEDTQRLAVDSKVNALDYDGKILLAVNDNKELLVWRNQADGSVQVSGQPDIYRGHGQPIGFVGIMETDDRLNVPPRLISIAAGDKPEIVVTDLANYQNELVEMELNVGQLGGSPYSIAKSRDVDRLAVGTDNGMVSISDPNDVSNKPLVSWQITAWNKHRFTPEYLFALSSRDILYRYNLQSGELEAIESRLSQIQMEDPDSNNRIAKIEFSHDGRFAVLQRRNGNREIEVWNLLDGTRTTISYDGKRGIENDKVLEHLTISSDGQYIAAGRIRFYVWKIDGTELGFGGIESQKEPFNCLKFFTGSSKIVVGAEDQIKVYDVEPEIQLQQTYSLILPDAVGQASIVDARFVDGQQMAIIRQSNLNDGNASRGLALVRLDTDQVTKIADFIDGEQGKITVAGEAIVLKRGAEDNIVRWTAGAGLSQQSVRVSGLRRSGRADSTRSIFSNVHLTTTDEIALSWITGGKQNAVTVSSDGDRAQLLVLATPTIDAVRFTGSQAVTLENGTVRKWDLGSRDSRVVRPAGSLSGHYRHFIMNREGSRALAAGKDGAQIIDINSGDNVATLSLDSDRLVCGTWSADGAKLAVGMNDGSIVEWFENQWNPLEVDLAKASIDRLCYSDDASTLVCIQSVDNVGIANVLRLKQDEAGAGRWIATQLSFPDRDPIVAVDISEDGSRVVTGSARGKVTLWLSESDVQSVASADSSERELMTLHLCPSPIRDVRFGQGEKYILAIEEDAPNSTATLIPAS